MIDVQKERQSKSISFLKRPHVWPCWPVCPVKRHVGQGMLPDIGIVVADGTWIVYRISLFTATAADLESCEKHEYETVEALVADGWEVD